MAFHHLLLWTEQNILDNWIVLHGKFGFEQKGPLR